MSDVTVAIPSGSSGLPAVRLPFDESLERNGAKQSLEMRSYRSWTIRPGSRGWTNTAQLSVKPTAIIVDMQMKYVLLLLQQLVLLQLVDCQLKGKGKGTTMQFICNWFDMGKQFPFQ
jgi:hypothetical protein